eukprot:TRINITY_DN18257_c0_g1_i1.p1 TRINITY_DN18257_c0_g1~~TRINITY_DN18257_c0_g1_i1.p1  ORF type:complete len:426 (+),score=84.63 TRINITY_DN18257_c0_g1_i1:64-1341(+)
MAMLLQAVILAVGASELKLHLMTDKAAAGAVCLDGSPGGFYYSMATNEENKGDWVFWLQGGGWCYNDKGCWDRGQGTLGSSKLWNATTTLAGYLDRNCGANPAFCNFNLVMMAYCDGASHASDIPAPVTVPGKPTPIYYRGRMLLDAALTTLSETFNLSSAKRFFFTGSSAGGLGVYLNTEYVHARVKDITGNGLQVFKAAGGSGFFLDHANIEGEKVYGEHIRYFMPRVNATTHSKCVEARQNGDVADCYFAPVVYDYIQEPFLVLNSAYDAWQTKCIYTTMPSPDWPNSPVNDAADCNGYPAYQQCEINPENCNQTQMTTMVQYEADFMSTLKATQGLTRPGNGAFIYSCHTHCAETDAYYARFKVNGTSMAEATQKWWEAPPTDPASAHNYFPCMYHTGPTGPRSCNPTCQSGEDGFLSDWW